MRYPGNKKYSLKDRREGAVGLKIAFRDPFVLSEKMEHLSKEGMKQFRTKIVIVISVLFSSHHSLIFTLYVYHFDTLR